MNDESIPMSDEPTDRTRAESNRMRSDGGTKTELKFGSRDLRTVLNYTAIAMLVLFAVVSAIQLYAAAGSVINQLIAAEYRVFFRAAFNLVVLLLSVGGISMQLDRLG